MKLERPFYVKEVMSRWAICPVDYRTREEAEAAAARAMDCDHALVLDCSNGPVGNLVAKYSKGRKVDW